MHELGGIVLVRIINKRGHGTLDGEKFQVTVDGHSPRSMDRKPAIYGLKRSWSIANSRSSTASRMGLITLYFLIRRVTASTSQKSVGKSWLYFTCTRKYCRIWSSFLNLVTVKGVGNPSIT